MRKHKHLEKRSLLLLVVFGSVSVIFAVLSVIGLTMNSQGAKDRYDALIAVDKAGGDVEAALNELRSYIHSHMNTQIGSDIGIRPPIQLSGTYSRLADAEKARVAEANEEVYTRAQAECEKTNPAGSLRNGRVQCIQAYIDTNSVKENVVDSSFYKFDFVPPVWSADLAGISLLLTAVFTLTFSISLMFYFRTRNMVNQSR
jgi:preprotein translocase subunit SecF